MNSYQSLAQVEQALEPYVALAGAMTGRQLTTERTERLAAYVGRPQDDLKIVHVAGTSGKTSTCYYIADLLHRSDAKVGLTVSPHMDSIAERVQIGGQPLAEEAFCRYFSEFMDVIADAPEAPTYFELMMVFAFWVFKKENVDYAVIETGLGGLHDSSNIASRADKLCVLTDIGLDHMHVLGSSIEEIAAQKVGIVKPGNVLVMHEQPEAVMGIVREYVAKQQGRLIANAADASLLFQQRNWQLAFRVYELLRERDDLRVLDSESLSQSKGLHVPGRMDVFQRSGKTIVLDGAHSEQKMSAFLASLKAEFPGRKFPVLMALKQGKELAQLAPLVSEVATSVIATEFGGMQDTRLHAASAEKIAREFEKLNVEALVETSLEHALARLLALHDEVVVITGSLYLVAEVRKLLR